jgi:microcystin-dependent protein
VTSAFIGELRLFAFEFPPKGWAFCDGQLMPINQNQALFSLLGDTYGGDGVTNFALPNLQGRAPMHFSSASPLGTDQGEESHTLFVSELATHTHPLRGTTTAASTTDPTTNLMATGAGMLYGPAGGSSVNLAPATVAPTGQGQAHENRQPFLVLNVCIAIQGIFPSHS